MTNLDRCSRWAGPTAGATLALAVALLLGMPASAQAGGDWNETGIAWQGYEPGLALAKKEGKPICLIFTTAWCPHCTRYSAIFHDPKVVEASRKFVMIHLDKDANKALSATYAPDGEYIPRTFFLSPDGVLQPDLHEQRAKFMYFYNEADPAGLLRGMSKALEKLGTKR